MSKASDTCYLGPCDSFVEVGDDAECVVVLPLSKSTPPQPKLVPPQVQLVKAESPARLAPGK